MPFLTKHSSHDVSKSVKHARFQATAAVYMRSALFWGFTQRREIPTFRDRSHQYSDVNNQQDATTFSFINLFKSALHVSGDKFAHPQEQFLTVYTAFGTMHRHCCRPVGSSVGALYQSYIYSQKVLLRMGEFVARIMLGWFKKVNKRKICRILLVVYILAHNFIKRL